MTIVELCHVEKRYQDLYALRGVNLALKEGEVMGLFGHNGAGKTTTIKLILGLIEPSAGRVQVFGHSPTASKGHNIRSSIGFLQENVSFYQQLTGEEVLRYFARLKGVGKQECRRLLAQLGLEEAAKRRVKTYSKGMKQRLGLAQALLGRPKLLLLDEPTSGLDPLATRDFYRCIEQFKQQGCTVILCSHVLPGVEKYLDRALIMGQGKILADGSINDLRQQANLPLQLLLRGENLAVPEHWLKGASQHGTSVQLQIHHDQKLQALQQLTSLSGLSDLEVQPPSLEDLYTHFIHEAVPANNPSLPI